MKPSKFQEKLSQARVFVGNEDYTEALQIYAQLCRDFPATPGIWLDYGGVAAHLQDFNLAERAFNRARELRPGDTQLLLQCGHHFKNCRQPDKARVWYEHAMAAEPENIQSLIYLAMIHERCHHLAEARAAVESCLKINPRDEQALYLSAVLSRRENKNEEAERCLRDLIAAEPKHPHIRHACRFELAQILDAAGRFDEAIQQLIEAKKIIAESGNIDAMAKDFDRTMEKNRQLARSLPKNISQVWSERYPAKKAEPVPPLAFLGGHPRSGTTLIEQVLSAHPKIAALDEPPTFMRFVAPTLRKMKGMDELNMIRRNALRRNYVQAFQREATDSAGKVLLDKNPSLTAQLCVLLQLFPELRVIIALRDPRDVVLSCYFQNIPLSVGNANYLTLEGVAKQYAMVMDVWLAIRQWEGFSFLETRYEDIVADLEKEGRRVTEFLGLTWNESQLSFYQKNRTQIFAPTYRDVTRPVYAQAVGRWRCYEKHLAPVLPLLEPYCRAFGYG